MHDAPCDRFKQDGNFPAIFDLALGKTLLDLLLTRKLPVSFFNQTQHRK